MEKEICVEHGYANCGTCKKEAKVSKSALAPSYKAMSLDRAITILKDRVDINECDGECDAEKPYTKCKECAAASVLNEVNDIVRAAL